MFVMSLYSCNGELYGCMWVEERGGCVVIWPYNGPSSSVWSSPLLECVIHVYGCNPASGGYMVAFPVCIWL